MTGIDGRLALSTSKTGDRVVQLVDLHGDVMGTLTLDAAGAISTVGYQATDEYGIPLDLNSGGVSANAPPRYGAHPNRGCRSWGLKPPDSRRHLAM